jgi:hypothetical protein
VLGKKVAQGVLLVKKCRPNEAILADQPTCGHCHVPAGWNKVNEKYRQKWPK